MSGIRLDPSSRAQPGPSPAPGIGPRPSTRGPARGLAQAPTQVQPLDQSRPSPRLGPGPAPPPRLAPMPPYPRGAQARTLALPRFLLGNVVQPSL